MHESSGMEPTNSITPLSSIAAHFGTLKDPRVVGLGGGSPSMAENLSAITEWNSAA